MKRKKERFRIIAERDNVLQPGKELFEQIRGRWRELYFGNQNPITLELACGRGEYTIGMASIFPGQNYIGVDIKGDRIWKGSTLAFEQQLKNVAFLRTHILMLEAFFEKKEVDDIWLVFPDPRARKKDIKRRLTSERYLEIYKNILKPGGEIRLKTDNTGLFEFTLELLQSRPDVRDLQFTADLYASPFRLECFDIKTRYEEMFAGKGETIKYLKFRFV